MFCYYYTITGQRSEKHVFDRRDSTPSKSHKFLAYFAFFLAGLSLVLMTTLLLIISGGDEWSPLGEYPVQEVIEVETLTVETVAVKCNDASDPVLVAGRSSWTRSDIVGTAVETGSGIGIRYPGCETIRYSNSIPKTVLEISQPTPALWYINGTERPIGEWNNTDSCSNKLRDGTLTIEDRECFHRRVGAQRTWQTTIFEIP
jgi:hypothetical protein